MEPWGFEPQIQPCHGRVIPFHYGPGILPNFSPRGGYVKPPRRRCFDDQTGSPLQNLRGASGGGTVSFLPDSSSPPFVREKPSSPGLPHRGFFYFHLTINFFTSFPFHFWSGT